MSNKVKQEQRYKREAQRSRKWFSEQTSETECSTKMNKREREKERARAPNLRWYRRKFQNRRTLWVALCSHVYIQINGLFNRKTFYKICFKVLKNLNIPASIKENDSVVQHLSRQATELDSAQVRSSHTPKQLTVWRTKNGDHAPVLAWKPAKQNKEESTGHRYLPTWKKNPM